MPHPFNLVVLLRLTGNSKIRNKQSVYQRRDLITFYWTSKIRTVSEKIYLMQFISNMQTREYKSSILDLWRWFVFMIIQINFQTFSIRSWTIWLKPIKSVCLQDYKGCLHWLQDMNLNSMSRENLYIRLWQTVSKLLVNLSMIWSKISIIRTHFTCFI